MREPAEVLQPVFVFGFEFDVSLYAFGIDILYGHSLNREMRGMDNSYGGVHY
jgi:hypothetical protein